MTEAAPKDWMLRKAQKEMELTLRSISAILIGLDFDGRVTTWNTAAEEELGVPASEMLGAFIENCELPWDWETVWEGMQRCLLSNASVQLDSVRVDGERGAGVLRLTLSPINDDDGEILGSLILGSNVTESLRMERQLAQAQKLESIGQLAAGIAHEINTPAQYVSDNTRFVQESFEQLLGVFEVCREMLTSEGGLPDELRERLTKSAEEADLDFVCEEAPRALSESIEGLERIAKIVGAMKDFSHPGVEEKVMVDINRALENTLTVARNEWKYVADVTMDVDGALVVPCLPGEMNQVFLNLIVNAAHAIDETIDRDAGEKGEIILSTRVVGDRAEIRIRDTGGGIPEAIRERIFEPFFTTKEVGRGTGQGLAIAHAVVTEKHGGSIEIETEPGEGTTFVIRLPMVDDSDEGECIA